MPGTHSCHGCGSGRVLSTIDGTLAIVTKLSINFESLLRCAQVSVNISLLIGFALNAISPLIAKELLPLFSPLLAQGCAVNAMSVVDFVLKIEWITPSGYGA